MTLINKENLDVVNTAFYTAINETFRDIAPGVWSQFTHRFSASGTSVDVLAHDGFPRAREWIGAKQFKDSRTYKRNYELRKWEASTSIGVDEVNQDQSGMVGAAVSSWVNQAAEQFYDSVVISELTSNPTGYDGTTLLSNSHSNVGGSGTSDNLTTNSLSYAELETGWQALMEMKDEYGSPLMVRPTHLMVGPAQAELAFQITGSDKIVGINDSGEIASSSIDSTSQLLPNYVGGNLVVVVTPEITGNEWFLMDLSKGDRKPMLLAEFQSVQGTVKDRPEDDNVFYNDLIHYSIVGKATPIPGDWHLVYGSVTS